MRRNLARNPDYPLENTSFPAFRATLTSLEAPLICPSAWRPVSGWGIALKMRRIWQLSTRSFLAFVSIRVNKAFDKALSAKLQCSFEFENAKELKS